MGSFTHDCVLAVGCGDAWIAAVEEFRIGLPKEYARMLSSPVLGSNGYASYIFGPDGSKDGWPTSADMDARRALFISFVQEQRFAQYIHLRFGETVDGVDLVSFTGFTV